MCQPKSNGPNHHHHDHHHHHGEPSHGHHHHEHHHHHATPKPRPASRREVLKGLTTAGLALATGGLPWGGIVRAVADDAHPLSVGSGSAKLFDLKKVANGVYAAIAKPTAMLNCNAAVVVNSDHVLVVDTHSKPSAAKALIKQIREEVTELPVRYVVDSHLHGDHAMGNEAYPEVFGGAVEVISSVKTREWLQKIGLPRVKESLEGIPKEIASLKARIEASKDESDRAILKTQMEGLDSYLKEMTPPRVSLPTMTFDQRLVIHRGGREIHLMFLGRAHTAGDVVAYIPSERVIATGDLMHGLLPYMGDGFPDEWPATHRALEAREFDRVIPGHGAVQEGKSVLAEFRGYVEEITEKVTRGVEKGQTLDEMQKMITSAQLTSLAANNTRRRVERELGALFTPSKPAEMVDDNVKSNVREVYTYLTKRKGKQELPVS